MLGLMRNEALDAVVAVDARRLLGCEVGPDLLVPIIGEVLPDVEPLFGHSHGHTTFIK